MLDSYVNNLFAKHIIHIDGDAFFASCEIAQNERLRGKPVVTGQDRGIVIAASYAAKALGVSRGMRISDVRKLFPQVIITSSSYEVYKVYSQRMNAIVRRYTPYVEEYSVDECFADITGLEKRLGISYEQIAHEIKNDLEKDLGLSFSLGLAPTKVLAKVASKWNKPSGFTAITKEKIPEFLEKIPAGKVWGIGPSTSIHLMKRGVKTALELAIKPEWWVRENLSKPHLEIWHELNGRHVLNVHSDADHDYKSVMKTGTFHPATNNSQVLLAELARNAERACTRLRAYNLTAKELHFFLKTQQFSYHHAEIRLPIATSVPTELLRHIQHEFPNVFNKNRMYRATGVILRGITPVSIRQTDLFGASEENKNSNELFKTVDDINNIYGPHSMHLAGSMNARDEHIPEEWYLDMSKKTAIPYWGEVY